MSRPLFGRLLGQLLPLAVVGLLAATVAAGCHEKAELTPPPAPLRPDPEAGSDTAKTGGPQDCDPVDPDHELKAKAFDQRSISEGEDLAGSGVEKLREAESAEVDINTRNTDITIAVKFFNDSLGADPYNVPATYNLAAAYARIGRRQCALNFLSRLMQMRTHPSKHAEVERHIDRLLGRKTTLDPDFSDMRSDDRFRALIAKMCEGTNDANCVYGGQVGGRER